LFSNRTDSIIRTSSLRGIGFGTEIEMGKAFASRLLSLIRTLPVSIAYFGTYSVGEADHALNFHIEGSTFPNWKGSDQKRLFKLRGDELSWTNPTSSSGAGTAQTVWKRVQ